MNPVFKLKFANRNINFDHFLYPIPDTSTLCSHNKHEWIKISYSLDSVPTFNTSPMLEQWCHYRNICLRCDLRPDWICKYNVTSLNEYVLLILFCERFLTQLLVIEFMIIVSNISTQDCNYVHYTLLTHAMYFSFETSSFPLNVHSYIVFLVFSWHERSFYINIRALKQYSDSPVWC